MAKALVVVGGLLMAALMMDDAIFLLLNMILWRVGSYSCCWLVLGTSPLVRNVGEVIGDVWVCFVVVRLLLLWDHACHHDESER